jgi:hypothetical protein
MKKFLLISSLACIGLMYACQKDSNLLDVHSMDAVTDRDGEHGHGHGGGGHHGGGHPHPDSLWHHGDSLHVDSVHHHGHHHGGLDSLGHPHPDSLFNHHGGHHPHDSLNNPGSGCHVPPVTITVTELPQLAQDWLSTNQPNAVIQRVRKVTRPDCKVFYMVKIEGSAPIRFDADGNKIG